MAVSSVTAPAAGTSNEGRTQTSVDFSMFLKLLTTQMQNQDPLKPLDSTEYTQQLAQFTQVEQTVKQTETLSAILGRLRSQDVAQASAFIGRDAEFASPVSGLAEGAPARWRLSVPAGTASLTARIVDAAGRTVASRPLSTDATAFEWDGMGNDGKRAAAGGYSLTLTALDSGGKALSAGVTSVGTVREVRSANGVVTLGVNGAQLPLDTLIRVTAGR